MALSRGRTSVLSLLFTILWMTVTDVADGSLCALDCASSNGTSVGSACVFTVDEELPTDTTIAILDIYDCTTPRLEPTSYGGVNEYIGLDGSELKLIKFADYDDPGTPAGEEGFLFCDGDIDFCQPPFVVSVVFRNVDDNNLTLSTNSSRATVTELVPYTEEYSLPITVEPELYATDADEYTGISYVINAVVGDVNYFRFANRDDRDSGNCFASGEKPVLVVDGAHIFDFEERPVIHLNVSIMSHHDDAYCDDSTVVQTEYSSLDVIVTDLDDQPPIFNATSYNYKASENSTEFSHVEGIYAYDQDTGIDADIIYSLKTDGLWDCLAYVDIDSQAEVTITKPFDFEEGYSECRLTIQATQADNDIQTATASLIIEISDVNDNCPLPVASATVGSYVNGDAFVSDPESLGRLTVSISDMDQTISYDEPEFLSNKFVLARVSEASPEYYIAPNQTLDGQTESGENVKISVTDVLYDGSDCSRSTTVEVVVVPSDVQDPSFDQADGYHVTVEEGYEGFLLQVAANNKDGNNEGIAYSLPERNGIYFTIDAETGYITLIIGFDFEVTTAHTLTVRATDARWETIERYTDTNVVITITDINDYVPVIQCGSGWNNCCCSPGRHPRCRSSSTQNERGSRDAAEPISDDDELLHSYAVNKHPPPE